jgi:phosphoglycolate phosphatase-like HAD superfamily hydrolase
MSYPKMRYSLDFEHRLDAERALDIAKGEHDDTVFVLFMRAQDVRDHFDGDEEAQAVLGSVNDEDIEALLGEDGFYEEWHNMCREALDTLRRRYDTNEETQDG